MQENGFDKGGDNNEKYIILLNWPFREGGIMTIATDYQRGNICKLPHNTWRTTLSCVVKRLFGHLRQYLLNRLFAVTVYNKQRVDDKALRSQCRLCSKRKE